MLKRKSLSACNLYLVLDTQVADYDTLLERAALAVGAGVDVIQLRDKNGSKDDIIFFSRMIRKILPAEFPYIINDQVDVAREVGAGVHVGQHDTSLKEARRRLGPEATIGVSCQRWEHLAKAQEAGADYVGFGSVYPTQTKPEREAMDLGLLERAVGRSAVPVFAIGGITPQNVQPLIDRGVTRVAVTRAILEAADVAATVRDFKDLLEATVSLVRE